jgi:hypothetical protein
MVWTGSIWLRIRINGGLLWTRYWTFGFHKMLGSSWVAAQVAASKEGLTWQLHERVSEWQYYQNRGHYYRNKFSVWYQYKTQFSHLIYTGGSCSVFTSAVITEVQMGKMSKLDWLIGWSSRDMWADSLYFLCVLFGLNKNRTMNNVQKDNNCVNIPLSQIFRSYKCLCLYEDFSRQLGIFLNSKK